MYLIQTRQNYDFRESKEAIYKYLVNFYVIFYLKITLMFLKIKYRWPLKNLGVKGADPYKVKNPL